MPAVSPSPDPRDPASHPPRAAEDFVHSESFLRELMARQLRLSVVCALAFVGMLIGLPLANFFLPELMARSFGGGFSLSWFLLGVGFFPAVWVIAWLFIRLSIQLEREEVDAVASRSRVRSLGSEGGQR